MQNKQTNQNRSPTSPTCLLNQRQRQTLFDVINAHEHVEKVLDIVDKLSSCTINPQDLLKKAFIQRYCPPSKSAIQLEEIHNFKQEGDETLYQAWKRCNDLLYKCPTHNLNSHQKVNIFYKGLDTMTYQSLDSQGPILNKTPTQAWTTIQTMDDHSQKWHNGSRSRKMSSSGSDGFVAIASKLEGLG
ncbi:hypothetical protein Tco_1124007 [Tanacetum coccineum]|uniref:Retrotransposon gag domain-containing protein n=1 Tax=Tanacetum coccineum TaxID=301880 RepID=A0ABQ5J7S7_9ASTR